MWAAVGLSGAALLEEVHPLGVGFDSQCSSSLCFPTAFKGVSTQFPTPVAMPAAAFGLHPSHRGLTPPIIPSKSFFLYIALAVVFYRSHGKEMKMGMLRLL